MAREVVVVMVTEAVVTAQEGVMETVAEVMEPDAGVEMEELVEDMGREAVEAAETMALAAEARGQVVA